MSRVGLSSTRAQVETFIKGKSFNGGTFNGNEEEGKKEETLTVSEMILAYTGFHWPLKRSTS